MCIPEQNMESNLGSHQQENGSFVVYSKILQSDFDSWGKADSEKIIVNYFIEGKKKIEWNDSVQLVFIEYNVNEISEAPLATLSWIIF